MLHYRVVASLRGNGILVERQLHISGENWQTIDRYNTSDLTNLPKKHAAWVPNAVALFSQPKANIKIEMPELLIQDNLNFNTTWGSSPDDIIPPETQHCKLDTIDITNPAFADGHMMDSIHQVVERHKITAILDN
jgi:hypothetical protein